MVIQVINTPVHVSKIHSNFDNRAFEFRFLRLVHSLSKNVYNVNRHLAILTNK